MKTRLKDFKLSGDYNKSVGNQSGRYFLVLFLFYFAMKVTGGHLHSSRGENPGPRLL